MKNDYAGGKNKKKPFLYYWPKIEAKRGGKTRAQKVLRFVKRYLPRSTSLCELGVGIGGVLSHMPKKYELYGVDIGSDFVKYTQKRVPRAHLKTSSMHNFKFSKTFDVVYSIFNCINFLKTFSQWKQTFKRVADHLEDDGLFIFDMDTSVELKEQANTYRFWDEEFGYGCDQKLVKGNSMTWRFLYFEQQKNGLFECNEYFFPEKIFALSKVEKELKKHFVILEKRDSYSMKKPDKHTGTILYVCRKKS